jgi:signal transduction histidine kinase
VAGGSPGYGLIGMQQRVSMLGGEFRTTTGTDSGFRIDAELPVGGSVG